MVRRVACCRTTYRLTLAAADPPLLALRRAAELGRSGSDPSVDCYALTAVPWNDTIDPGGVGMPDYETLLADATQLPIADRLQLIDVIWDTLPADSLSPLSDE